MKRFAFIAGLFMWAVLRQAGLRQAFATDTKLQTHQTVASGGGSGTPGGSSGQIQYNNAGAFGGLAIGPGLTNNSGSLEAGTTIPDYLETSVGGVAFNVADGAAGNSTPTTVSLAGAATDWTVLAHVAGKPVGVFIHAEVTGSGTVALRARNDSGSTWNVTNQTVILRAVRSR